MINGNFYKKSCIFACGYFFRIISREIILKVNMNYVIICLGGEVVCINLYIENIVLEF